MTLHKSHIIYFLLSLWGILFQTPFGLISITDIVVIIIAIIQILRAKLFHFDKSRLFFLILIIYLFFLGIFFSFNSEFYIINHYKNLLRVLFSFIFICSLEFDKILRDKDSLKKIIIFTLNFHSILLILDYFFQLPISWNGYTYFGISDFQRPRGLYPEPSFAAITIILNLFLLLTLNEFKLKKTILGFAALVISTSLIGILGAALLFLVSLIKSPKENIFQLRTIFLIILIVITFTLISEYVLSRITLYDGSFLKRFYGSYLTLNYILANYPWFGLGLGSDNYDLIPTLSTLEFSSQNDLECHAMKKCDAEVNRSNTNSIISLITGGGITLLFLYFKMIYHAIGIRNLNFLICFYVLISFGSPFIPTIIMTIWILSYLNFKN